MDTSSEPESDSAMDAVNSSDPPEATTSDPPVRSMAHATWSSPKLFRSSDALLETGNRFESLSNDEVRSPLLTRKQATKPPLPPKPHQASQAQPAATQQQKRDRVPTITIKWETSRVRTEMKLSNLKQDSFLLQQIRGGTVVKITTIAVYEAFLKRCVERQIPHFTHQVDAKKPTRIVLLGLPNTPVEEIREELAKHGVVPEDIKPMRIRNSKFLEHNNYILYFKKGTMTTAKLRDIKAINSRDVQNYFNEVQDCGQRVKMMLDTSLKITQKDSAR